MEGFKMPSNAFSGINTQFKRGDGASNEAFTTIAEVKNISGPDVSRDFIDVSSLDSTDGYREFIAGFRDAGQVVLSMNYTRVSYDLLKADFDTNSARNYQIVFGDTGLTTYDFAGWVVGLTHNTDFESAVALEVTIKIDGPIDLTS
jgi:predicted secreted protein